jgi:Protein of unknown function (DUF1501)
MTFENLHQVRFTRRQALIAGGLGTVGLSLPQLLHAETRTRTSSRKSVILVVPWGGPSQHDTFDPKPDAPAEVRSVFKPIRTRTAGLMMGEHLPRLAAMSNRFSVLRAVSHHISTHNAATHFVLTGYPPQVINAELTNASRQDYPTIGSALARYTPSSDHMPSYVQLPQPMQDNGAFSPGQLGGFLGPAYDPLVVTPDPSSGKFIIHGLKAPPDVGPERADSRRDLLQQLDRHAALVGDVPAVRAMDSSYARAYEVMRSAAKLKAFDVTSVPDRVRERYGRGIGASLLVARRLVESGVRLVLVSDTQFNTNGKWDTHSGFTKDLHLRYQESDIALSALLADLESSGLLESTVVAWMGEFGRTPQRKAEGGRDHWPKVYSILLAGGGIQGGRVLGASDSLGAEPRDGMVNPRDILATVYHLLGVPPDTELRDQSGRPQPLCTGSVIHALL